MTHSKLLYIIPLIAISQIAQSAYSSKLRQSSQQSTYQVPTTTQTSDYTTSDYTTSDSDSDYTTSDSTTSGYTNQSSLYKNYKYQQYRSNLPSFSIDINYQSQNNYLGQNNSYSLILSGPFSRQDMQQGLMLNISLFPPSAPFVQSSYSEETPKLLIVGIIKNQNGTVLTRKTHQLNVSAPNINFSISFNGTAISNLYSFFNINRSLSQQQNIQYINQNAPIMKNFKVALNYNNQFTAIPIN